jgi:Membrane protein involved in the export of O-antigen and teichoic acid
MDQATTFPAARTRPLAGTALRGMAWMTWVVLVAKLSGFGAQWALGILLSPADFGVFALVTVTQNFIEGFRDIGASRILVQQGRHYDRLARPILKLSLAANAIAIFLLVGGAPAFAHYYSEPQLLWLIPISAIAIPWTTAAVVYKAKASRDLNYPLVGKIESAIPLIQNALMVLMAWLGFGVMSFVVPFALTACFQMIAYRRAVGPLPPGAQLNRALFWEIFHQSKWLMIGAYGMGLVLRGDYLVLGRLFDDKASLGIYYFGFQLAASLGVLFTSGLQNVLMPAFSALAEEPARMRRAFVRSCRMLLIVATLIAGLFIAVCPELLQLLWRGKWNAAALVAIAMAASLPFKLLAPVGTSMVEALGRWRRRTEMLLLDGVLVCVAAAIGAYQGGVTGAAVAIAIQRIVMGLGQSWIAAHSIGMGGFATTSLFSRGLFPFVAGLALLALQPDLVFSASPDLFPMLRSALLKIALFSAGWLVAALCVNRDALDDVKSLIHQKLSSRLRA